MWSRTKDYTHVLNNILPRKATGASNGGPHDFTLYNLSILLQENTEEKAAPRMSSVSEIFLMHLKVTALNNSSDVSIVQDNANSNYDDSLTKLTYDGQICKNWDSSMSTITWARMPTSRWEEAVDIDDGQPGIPARQDSYNLLQCSQMDDNSQESTRTAYSERESKDSLPKKPCRQSSGRDLVVSNLNATVALPRIPRRNINSNKNIEGDELYGSDHELGRPKITSRQHPLRRSVSFSQVDPALELVSPLQ